MHSPLPPRMVLVASPLPLRKVSVAGAFYFAPRKILNDKILLSGMSLVIIVCHLGSSQRKNACHLERSWCKFHLPPRKVSETEKVVPRTFSTAFWTETEQKQEQKQTHWQHTDQSIVESIVVKYSNRMFWLSVLYVNAQALLRGKDHLTLISKLTKEQRFHPIQCKSNRVFPNEIL